MFQRKTRRFRRRPNDRNRMSHHAGSNMQARIRPNAFLNDQTRNNFRSSLSAEKLLEKYNSLAKEAMSSGDKTLAENYLQHADHFMRIVEDKNKNRNQNRLSVNDKPANDEKNLSENGTKTYLIKGDLSKQKDLKKIIQFSKKKLKYFDCLINNASLFENDNLLNFTTKSWDMHLNTNLKAPAYLSKEFAKNIGKSKNANIINIIDQRVFKLTPLFFLTH